MPKPPTRFTSIGSCGGRGNSMLAMMTAEIPILKLFGYADVRYPVGSSSGQWKKGAGVNGSKRLPLAFEYGIEDELATAVPAPKQQQQQQQAGTASTKRFRPAAPAAMGVGEEQAIEGSSRKHGQTQTSVEDRIEDCIMVAVASVKGATANSKVTSTKLGLQRLRQVRDTREPGTASGRFIDGFNALNPDVEDDHDRVLAAAEVAAREDHEDAVALGIS
ncbi:hypothetical protein VTI74DRAFT_9921 [Chaetomium olivicolor]